MGLRDDLKEAQNIVPNDTLRKSWYEEEFVSNLEQKPVDKSLETMPEELKKRYGKLANNG